MKNFIILFLGLFLFTSCQNKTNEVKVTEKSAVRGAWLTNVDSKVLNSKENIIEALDFCVELNINSLFVVTLNKGMTTYPSKVMKSVTGVEIDPEFEGRDPLRELIDEAKKRNIKIIPWFEFGFSSSYKLDGGEIIAAKSHWASKGIDGKIVTKNGFDWMNGFHPEVQNFLLSLIMEVVENYEIDGIQGDDRLPAMPSEAGYDEYTVNRYKEEHNGKEPPIDSKDPYWLQWRADILNEFMKRIYESVKGYNKNLIVSMAPSIYPWSLEEYLQDWPNWINNGYVDLLCPQVYRYDIDRYTSALDEILKDQISPEYLNRMYPGVLLKVGDYYPSEEFLIAMIESNRKKGIEGEVFFFYEGLKKYPELFKEKLYKEYYSFPDLVKE